MGRALAALGTALAVLTLVPPGARAADAAVTSVRFFPATVDTTTGPQTVHAIVTVANDVFVTDQITMNLLDDDGHQVATGTGVPHVGRDIPAWTYYFDVPITVPMSDGADPASETLTPEIVTQPVKVGAGQVPGSPTVTRTHTPDTSAPTVTGASISPVAVSLDQRDTDVTLAFRATDDASGVKGLLARVNTQPDCSGTDEGWQTVSQPHIDGTAQDGTFSVPLQLLSSTPPGTYYLCKVLVTDAAGNYAYAAVPTPPAVVVLPHPAASTITITSASLSSATNPIDTTHGDHSVEATFTAQGDDAGMMTGARVTLDHATPTSDNNAHIVSRSGDTVTFAEDLTIPWWGEPGAWSIQSISVYDPNGVPTSYDPATAGGTHSVTVVHETDTTPPSFSSITLSPTGTATPGNGLITTRPAAVRVTAHITDDVSGVAQASVVLDDSNGTPQPTGGLSLVAGTPNDGTYTGIVLTDVPVHVGSAVAVDKTYNSASASAAVLDGAGTSNVMFGADTTAPTIGGVSLASPTIDLGSAVYATTSLTTSFTDPGGSGLTALTPSWLPLDAAPDAAGSMTSYATVTGGTPSSGTARVTIGVLDTTPPGRYQLVGLDAVDAAGNAHVYGTDTFGTVILTVADDADVTPPVIDSGAAIGPTSVSSTDGSTTVGLRLTTSDERLLSSVSAVLTSPSGYSLPAVEALPHVPGTAYRPFQSLTSVLLVDLPPGAEPGRWTWRVTVGDAGPGRTWSAGDLEAAELPFDVTVTAPADSTGPHLAPGSGSVVVVHEPAPAESWREGAVIVLAHLQSEGAPIVAAQLRAQPAEALPPFVGTPGTAPSTDEWITLFHTVDPSQVGGGEPLEVVARDAAGNRLHLYAADLAGAGQPSHVTIGTNVPNPYSQVAVPPASPTTATARTLRSSATSPQVKVVSVRIPEPSMDTTRDGATEQVAVVVDGLDWAAISSLTFTASGSPTETITVPLVDGLVPGAAGGTTTVNDPGGRHLLDGTLTAPVGARAGTWTLTSAQASRGLTVDPSTLPASTFTVSDRAPDTTDPVIDDVALDTSNVDVRSEGAVVHVIVHAHGKAFADPATAVMAVHIPGLPTEADLLGYDRPISNATGTVLVGTFAVPAAYTTGTWTLDDLAVRDGLGRLATSNAVLHLNVTGTPPAPPTMPGTGGKAPVSAAPAPTRHWTGVALSVPAKIHLGKAFRVTALVSGLPKTRTLTLQHEVAGRWATVATLRWSTARQRWTAVVTLHYAGPLRLHVGADASHAATSGPVVTRRLLT